jgi:chaperonin cofactor prefoldin
LIGIQMIGQVAILFGILGVLIGALMFSPRRRGRAQRRREKAAEALIAAVQHLMSQSFIESNDGVIFEAAPHRAFLLRRIDDLRLERAGLEARQSELVHLRAQLIRANEALGLPPEDGEVRAVDEERARLDARDAGLISLERRLEAQLEEFNRALERLRLLATREALSRKVGELLEERRGDAALRAAAEIEVDVVAIHAEMSRLGVRLSDADLSLRAALEAEAAARGQSTRLIAETKPKPTP